MSVLFREIIAACRYINTKHTNTLLGQKAERHSVKHGGADENYKVTKA
jgi:hypothetical protein